MATKMNFPFDEFQRLINEGAVQKLELLDCPKDSKEYQALKEMQDLIQDSVYLDFNKKKIDRMPSCKLFWIKDDYYNAEADASRIFKRLSVYYIGLHDKIINKLYDEVKNTRVKCRITNEISLETIRINNLLQIKPTDINTIDADIANLILIYIVFHEVGHILYGHTDIRYQYEDYYMYQAEEYLADINGLEKVFSLLLASNGENAFNAVSMFAEAIFIWCLLAKIQKKQHIDNYDPSSEVHPHTLIRFWYMKNWIINEIQNNKYHFTSEETERIEKECDLLLTRLHTDALERIYNLDDDFYASETKKIKERIPMIKDHYKDKAYYKK